MQVKPSAETPYIARTVVQDDFPMPGATSYVCLPWDLDHNVGLEEFGNAKVKSGICRSHGHDLQRSLLTTLDYANIAELPSGDLKNAIDTRMNRVPAIVARYKEAKGLA